MHQFGLLHFDKCRPYLEFLEVDGGHDERLPRVRRRLADPDPRLLRVLTLGQPSRPLLSGKKQKSKCFMWFPIPFWIRSVDLKNVKPAKLIELPVATQQVAFKTYMNVMNFMNALRSSTVIIKPCTRRKRI